MAVISSTDRLKSKTSKFCLMRSACVDLGSTMIPRWMCQRITTCAADLPYLAPIPASTGLLVGYRRCRRADSSFSVNALGTQLANKLLIGELWGRLNLVYSRHHIAMGQ